MLVSVIIPTYNSATTLPRCLLACLRQTHQEIEVIVVDDGSTDETARIASNFAVHYLRQERAGPAAARNRGAQAARAELIVFTDADCIPEPEWIERLLTGFRDDVVGVGGSYGIANEDRLLARMIHEEIQSRHAAFADEVDFLGSFNVAYRKRPFDAVSGFDETFTEASGEDNDLAYRLQDAGGVLRFVPEARVAHVHPERLGRYLRSQRRHGFWRVKLYRKHPQRSTRGDQYAGFLELIAPPCALGLTSAWIALALFAVFQAPHPLLCWALGSASLTYAALHLPKVARMIRQTGDVRMFGFWPVALLRDLARAWGLAHGVWAFCLRRSAGS